MFVAELTEDKERNSLANVHIPAHGDQAFRGNVITDSSAT
jgi:hypothetical protein